MRLKWVILGLAAWACVSAKFEPERFNEKIHTKTNLYSTFDLPSASDRFVPTFPENSKRYLNKHLHHLKAGCDPGYTGPDCSNPICYNRTALLQHDGTLEFGDLVESDYSLKCADSFTFHVDNFMDKFYVIIDSVSAGNPVGTVYGPEGDEVAPCGTMSPSASQTIHMYCETWASNGAGLYSVKLSIDNDAACQFEVRSPTKLAMDGGFVEDKRDDDVQYLVLSKSNQGVFRYPTENANTYLAFAIQNELFPVHPEAAHIYRNGLWDSQYNLTARYGCTTSHITSTPFNCTQLHTYHIKLQGYDQEGYGWQRIYDFECNAPILPTDQTLPFSISTQTPSSYCENGGILNADGCYCGEFFDGPHCEVPLCLNGGSYLPESKQCQCADGWSGDHCQHVRCGHLSDDSFEESSSALGFVIRSAPSMRNQIDEIVEAAIRITSYYSVNFPLFFQSYVVTVVQNNGVLFTREFENIDGFLNSLRSIITPPTETECDDSLLLGISQTLASQTFKKFPNSPVFVFSDGVANDDANTRGYLWEQLVQTRAQVYFMLTDSATGNCNIDVSSNLFSQMRDVSQLSRGLLVQTNLTQLGEATIIIAKDLWQLDTLLTNDLEDCRQAPQYQPFFVDPTVDYLVLRATGSSLAPIITSPNQTQIKPSLVYSNGNVFIWKTDRPPQGTYLLNMNAVAAHSTVCQYRLLGRSIYRLYTAVTTALNTDAVEKTPVYNEGSHLVAHVDGIYLDDPLQTTVEATLWYNDPVTSRRQIMYSTSGIWRDACNYELYFGIFNCPRPNLQFYANIYVTDSDGATVLRTITNYCSASQPNPPDADCLNGGVLYNNTCYCPTHFTGDKCQQIACQNGGTALFGLCQCPVGFDGQFCETTMCTEYNPYGFWGNNDRSLTIMIHDSLTTRSTLRTLNDVAPRVVGDILQQHPRWIANYQLVRFNDSDYKITVDSTTGADLVTGITDLYNQNRAHTGYSCRNLDLYATILDVISNHNIRWGGIVYIFLYGQPSQDLKSYSKILQIIETNKIQINVVQSSLNPCGNDITTDGLISLTQFSGGTFITASAPNAGSVFSQIPTNYMSNLIYENVVDECSDTTFYIPIDDGAQSFTAYVQGELIVAPTYTAPDASEVNVANLYSDLGTSSRMDHIVRECDRGWYLQDNHCWKFSYDRQSWFDALLTCHNDGATLANVFNQKEQDALDLNSEGAEFWIGLSDLDNVGAWYWDTNNVNFTLSINDTQYTHWQDGQPTNTDDKRCALDSNIKSHGWVASSCNDKHFYVCSKHAYTTEFQPTDPNQNHIARGIWKMRVKANGQCSVSIRSQSSIQIAARFSSNIHDDVGKNEPSQSADTNRVIVHVNGVRNQRAVEYAHFYSDNFTIQQAHTLSYRDNCLYSFISTTFSCPNFAYQMLITGVDDAGYFYQRIVPAACVGGIDENSCSNGGVYYKGSCICSPDFTGETCQYAICQNGGVISASLDRCICMVGFKGQFCEQPICTRNFLNVPEITSNHRTFIVAVDGTLNDDMSTVNENFEATLSSVLNSTLTSDPAWFSNFVGIVFRDAEAKKADPPLNPVSDVVYANNSQDFVKLLTAELKAHNYTATQPKRDIFTALVKAAIHPSVVPESQLFVITAGNAEDTVDEQTVLSALQYSHITVNFLFIGDSKPPGDAANYDDPTVATLFETAHISGGSAYQLPSADSLRYNWQTILTTLHRSYYVITHRIANCSNYIDYIQLDSNGTQVVVDLFAQSATDIAVIDEQGQHVKAATVLKSKTNAVTSFVQSGDQPGIWSLYIDKDNANPGSCTLNVRGQSTLEVEIGFTQDTLTDGGLHDGSAVHYPKGGMAENAVVASASAGVLTYVQIFDLDETRLAWASPLIQRASCAYSYITQSTFRCHRNSFVLSVEGLDDEGHPFRRTFTLYCDGDYSIQTTASPPPTTPAPETSPQPKTTALPICDSSVPNIDIIIALDSSATIPDNQFYATVQYVRAIASTVEIAQDKTRISLGTYDSLAHIDEDLNNNTDVSAFVGRCLELMQFGYTGVDGNNIQSVLDYVSTINSTSPFRSSPTRKIVLLFSSQGWDKGNIYDDVEHGFTDPTDSAKALSQAGVEFFLVGVGSKANMTQLSAISKCARQANNDAGIRYAVEQFTSIICSSTPVC